LRVRKKQSDCGDAQLPAGLRKREKEPSKRESEAAKTRENKKGGVGDHSRGGVKKKKKKKNISKGEVDWLRE